MSPNPRLVHLRPQPFQTGFTLVEIMVGMVIGMLATLVIMQVFSVFENQKRATTGAADSLTNGNLALFKIAREIEVAGYSLAPLANSPLLCAQPIKLDPGIPTITGVPSGGVLNNDISPVVITDGGLNGSDTITLHYGSENRVLGGSASGGIPSIIKTAAAGNNIQIQSTLGCAVNDVALIMDGSKHPTPAACSITYIRDIPQPSTQVGVAPNITVNPGTITVGDATLGNGTPAPQDGSVSCMGIWHQVTYQVTATSAVAGSSSNLERQDSGDPNNLGFLPLVADIVSIQAQYGISAAGLGAGDPNFNQVVAWVDATATTGFANPSVADRNRIKAVRIAVVARDAKMEPYDITTQCDTTAKTGLCAWVGTPGSPAPEINLTDPNWRRYRYRVFETIIPLRNVIWSKTSL